MKPAVAIPPPVVSKWRIKQPLSKKNNPETACTKNRESCDVIVITGIKLVVPTFKQGRI
jgi:hypothetical protein